MSKPRRALSLCPCQSDSNQQQAYARCCGRFHKGKLVPKTAEELMRSRYSAYVLELAQYLYRTWKTDKRPALEKLRALFQQGVARPQYCGLTIIETVKGGPEDTSGVVEFIARYKEEYESEAQGSKDGHQENILELRERSLFERVGGRWVYVEAENESENKTENG